MFYKLLPLKYDFKLYILFYDMYDVLYNIINISFKEKKMH